MVLELTGLDPHTLEWSNIILDEEYVHDDSYEARMHERSRFHGWGMY